MHAKLGQLASLSLEDPVSHGFRSGPPQRCSLQQASKPLAPLRLPGPAQQALSGNSVQAEPA